MVITKSYSTNCGDIMFNSQLTSFVCVADSGSFNKAAEKLFISSTAVIKQMNALEKHLNMKLFDRTNHGILLTPAGKVIYKHAKILFDYSEKAIAEALQTMTAELTTFSVGTSILNPCKPFMDLWYKVNHQFPNYRLHVVPFEDDHSDILSEISALGEKFDFIIAACDSRQWLNRCNFQQIGTYRHCIAVPREHPLAAKKSLTIQDLYGETLMLGKRGDSATVDSIRDEIEKHPLIKTEDTSQFYDISIFNHCVQTRCVLLTLECWADVHPALVTIPVDWDFSAPYGILYQLQPGDDIEKFVNAIKNSVGAQDSE